MSEIVAVIGLSTVGLYAVIIAVSWSADVRQRNLRERSRFLRLAAYAAVLMAAVAGWVMTGIATFLYGSAFWRGAWFGASAVLGTAYVPWLIWTMRTELANRKRVETT
jgi:hypothetical protein